ncbi:outer membrane hemolysin activator protein [Caballeronia cordobensis]|nr:outer membrane hemolysin activator protein [Burkholderia sp. RPE67]
MCAASRLLLCLLGTMPMLSAMAADVTPSDVANAARTNAEQQKQIQQPRDAQQRAAIIAAPVVRAIRPAAGEWPALPAETPG